MKLTFVQVGELLNMSSVGAKNRIVKYEKELKQYILYDDKGKIKGYDDSGIEELRNIGIVRRNVKNTALKQENEILKERINGLNNELSGQNRYIQHLEDELKNLKDENIRINEELKTFKTMSFWKRLTYKA